MAGAGSTPKQLRPSKKTELCNYCT